MVIYSPQLSEKPPKKLEKKREKKVAKEIN